MQKLFRFRPYHRQWLISLAFSAMIFVITLPSLAAPSPRQDVQRLDNYIEQAIARSQAKDFQGAAQAFSQYKDGWFEIEDGVKEFSRQAYRDIEDAMGEVKFALSEQPVNADQLLTDLKQLHRLNQTFIAGEFVPQTATPTSTSTVTIDSLLDRLSTAETALNQNDISGALTEIASFKTDWLEVEGVVAAKSATAYNQIETTMAKAYGALKATPAQVEAARAAIASLKQDLQPYAGSSLRYTTFDAAVILLREGLEALLVLVALLAFLRKSGNGDKQRWLWFGAGVGVFASVATALVLNLVFASVASGANRELIEGLVGLAAAAMLFYVSYWLHSKSSLMAWQGYIRNQMTSALATNSVLSLALLAFLAVYREGAETTLFYIGIAPSISTTDLLLGLALGALALAVIAVLMLVLEMKIPLKPFFLVTSLLIYYLGFKFLGSGIHALQVAGLLPATPANFLPALEGWGIYPTWETTLPQLGLLAAAIAVVLYARYQATKGEAGSVSSES